MADKTLEDKCDEMRFRQTPDGVLIAVCSRNPQGGKTCEYQKATIQIAIDANYRPQTADMFVCSKGYQKNEKKQAKQTSEWDSDRTYKINSYDSDAGWKSNPLDGGK